MDLLQTVRKEGSRGGRSEFKWEDVKDSHHRENYLGHSLMAPVGRWQQGRDLNWYAKAEGDQQSEADARKEELRKVKQAEEDAMAKALGLEPPQRPDNNANMTQLGPRAGAEPRDLPSAPAPAEGATKRTLRDTKDDLRRERRRDREGHGHRRRSRSREHGSRRHRDREEQRASGDRDRHRHRHHRSRSRSRERRRSRSREDRRPHGRGDQKRDHERTSARTRSRSPYKRRSERD